MVNMYKILVYSKFARLPVSWIKKSISEFKVLSVLSWSRVLLRCKLTLKSSKGSIPYTANHLFSGCTAILVLFWVKEDMVNLLTIYPVFKDMTTQIRVHIEQYHFVSCWGIALDDTFELLIQPWGNRKTFLIVNQKNSMFYWCILKTAVYPYSQTKSCTNSEPMTIHRYCG